MPYPYIPRAAKEGSLKAQGWPETAYGVSKIGVTVMSFIQQRNLDRAGADDIVVNAVSLHKQTTLW